MLHKPKQIVAQCPHCKEAQEDLKVFMDEDGCIVFAFNCCDQDSLIKTSVQELAGKWQADA